jgi:hypothetical protein
VVSGVAALIVARIVVELQAKLLFCAGFAAVFLGALTFVKTR